MFLQWQAGRQFGSYSKMSLLPEWVSGLLNLDLYILRFPEGCSVIRHRDPVAPGYRHYRMNIRLSGTGEMYIEGPVKQWSRLAIFRPDLYFHGLEPISNKMYMLSAGCRIKGAY